MNDGFFAHVPFGSSLSRTLCKVLDRLEPNGFGVVIHRDVESFV